MTRRILHFTLGPVQGFIADARRTRDLWAGSFLLSWLSGQAMAALAKAAGKEPQDIIIFPDISKDELFQAVWDFRSSRSSSRTPHVGSLPNRFKADVTGFESDPGQVCQDAIVKAWGDIEHAVWKQFFAQKDGFADFAGDVSKKIWSRQVDNFWQMNWVTGEEPEGKSDSNWLDLRKNWRDGHWGKDAAGEGDLCRLMGRYQEISGLPRIGKRREQDAFYAALREREYIHPGTKEPRRLRELNIGDTERLCAIALIKRLFPLLDDIEPVIGWRPGGSAVNIINWPSVSYVAAVPWLESLGEIERRAYFSTIEKCLTRSYRGETETRLFDLPEEQFFTLDGHLLHKDGIRAWPEDGIKGEDAAQKEDNLQKLLEAHRSLCAASVGSDDEAVKKEPSEFYALLLMDGDSVGARIRGHESVIKRGLAAFAAAVGEYFKPERNSARGALIYAGGDDVLALVPLDHAMRAARAMRDAYQTAFIKAVTEDNPSGADPAEFTLSGAIVFAQYKIPLRAVLDKAHHYLDKVAKDGNGRDSLAIAVMKPGGVAFDWVSCWQSGPVETMDQIARDRSDYSSSFFYNIRQRYAPLFADDHQEHEAAKSADRDIAASFGEPDFMQAVLIAEYKKQPGRSKLSLEEVKEKIDPLMTIGKPLNRKSGTAQPSDRYDFDGALVARFMSEEGHWRKPGENTTTGEEKSDDG